MLHRLRRCLKLLKRAWELDRCPPDLWASLSKLPDETLDKIFHPVFFSEDRLTLKSLRLTEPQERLLKQFTKEQRKVLYDLCTIFFLTFYKQEERAAAQQLRELLRVNTFDKNYNLCEFDKTDADKKREAWNHRVSLLRP
jgi:hypothetical protein